MDRNVIQAAEHARAMRRRRILADTNDERGASPQLVAQEREALIGLLNAVETALYEEETK